MPRMSIALSNSPGCAERWEMRTPATLPDSMFTTFSFLVMTISLLVTAETAPVRVAFFWTP